MAILKCKMCGGDLEITAGATVAECEFCGTKQTLPKVNDEVVQNLFNRANNLRIKCEFDKAEQIYEKIVEENDAEAEAHWGIVLCKYGIEYVEDPKTYKRIPTCHRTSYDAVTTDADYLAAVEHADTTQRGIYEAEAKAIDEIQKGILSIVKEEKPFDVFLCYKETDENGKRTIDSTIANDIYHQLTQEGLKVFYAAITLEDKLGREYEPYIFAALNSARVMLVIGTKPQYFTAVWVKNEWSRFIKLMKSDRSKLLIPCYRDMDAYDLPEEFSHLQAQDMSKIGFINDVVRGIKKVAVKDEPKTAPVNETVVSANANTAPLLKRAFMFLEDGDWARADDFCEQVLNIDPECAEAYLGKLMAETKVKKQEALGDQAEPFDRSNNYQKAVRFADEKLKTALVGYIDHINTRNENTRISGIYTRAKAAMNTARNESAYKEAARIFETIADHQDSAALAKVCYEKAEMTRKDAILADGINKMSIDSIFNYEAAIKLFQSISGWKDADERIATCKQKLEELEEQLKEQQKREEQEYLKKKKRKRLVAIISLAAVILGAAIAIPVTTKMTYQSTIASYYSGAMSAKEAQSQLSKVSWLVEVDNCTKVLLNKDTGAYPEAASITEVTIPDGVTSIGSDAFRGRTSLTSITIGDSVTGIDDLAFANCSGLTSITIPDSVTSIGDQAFYGCSGLTSITIPDSVTKIGSAAFYNCGSLKSIIIPDSVTSINDYAFKGCSSLTSITIGDSVTSIGDSAFSRCSGLTNITIPDSVTSIGDYAFSGCASLTSITIPDSVTSIGYSAFHNCSSLKSITIPDSVTSIGNFAFYGCSGLTSITIGDSVTSIGDSAFQGCRNLQEVVIPDSVTSVGSQAFYCWTELQTVYCEAKEKPSGWVTNWQDGSTAKIVWGYQG